MAKFVPQEKQSKQKQQRELYTAQRKDLGGPGSVARKAPNPKAYVHKKSGQR